MWTANHRQCDRQRWPAGIMTRTHRSFTLAMKCFASNRSAYVLHTAIDAGEHALTCRVGCVGNAQCTSIAPTTHHR